MVMTRIDWDAAFTDVLADAASDTPYLAPSIRPPLEPVPIRLGWRWQIARRLMRAEARRIARQPGVESVDLSTQITRNGRPR